MKLLITGGHLTPALAVIDEILERLKTVKKEDESQVKIVFVGRKFLQSKRSPSFEYQEIKKRDIPFINLEAGRVTRVISFQSVLHLLKIPYGFYKSLRILMKEKPDVILSFGGYLAVPVVIMGALLRIRTYTHEQTIHPGLGNRVIGLFARKIFISFPQTNRYFNAKKVVVSGNPIRKQIFDVIENPFKIPKNRPVIYVTGGSTGSHAINIHIQKILLHLLEKYIVIHQTGNIKQFNDYATLVRFREALPEDLSRRYFIREHFLTDEVGSVFKESDLVISRSGANTFFELMELQKPALFIPLPWSSYNEQQKQAEVFKKMGTGEVFNQKDSSENLLKLINEMIENLEEYKKNFKNFNQSYTTHAVKVITDYILNS